MKNSNQSMNALIVCCFSIFIIQSNAQTLIHAYELNGTYSDDFGGSPVIPNGGTLTATSYEFEGGEGPNVSNVINPTNYIIEIKFTLLETDYWRKLVDFKDGNSDNGIYVNDQRLYFYPDAIPGPGVIEPDIPCTLRITRDGATKMVTILVDGNEHLSFEDADNHATFSGPGNIIHFMRDDFNTPPLEGHDPENPSGSLDYIRIYEAGTDPCGAADSDCDGTNDACDICTGGDDNGPCNSSVLPPLSEIPSDWLCSNNNNSEKILICHQGTTMCVSESAANTHLSHGDFLGPCFTCPQYFQAPFSNAEPDVDNRPVFELSPNPATDQIALQLSDEVKEGQIIICDQLGREVFIRQLNAEDSFIHMVLDENRFPGGMYYISIVTDGNVQTKRLVIDK